LAVDEAGVAEENVIDEAATVARVTPRCGVSIRFSSHALGWRPAKRV
jgi:hypothetical protein